MNSEHDIPLLVVYLVKHTVISETSIVDNVVDLAKGTDRRKRTSLLSVM